MFSSKKVLDAMTKALGYHDPKDYFPKSIEITGDYLKDIYRKLNGLSEKNSFPPRF